MVRVHVLPECIASQEAGSKRLQMAGSEFGDLGRCRGGSGFFNDEPPKC